MGDPRLLQSVPVSSNQPAHAQHAENEPAETRGPSLAALPVPLAASAPAKKAGSKPTVPLPKEPKPTVPLPNQSAKPAPGWSPPPAPLSPKKKPQHTTQAVSQQESDDFFALYDTDGSGAVDIDELVQMVAAFKERDSSTLNRTKIQKAWDADGDGSVTRAEFYERLLRAAKTNPELFSQFRAAAAKKKAGASAGASMTSSQEQVLREEASALFTQAD